MLKWSRTTSGGMMYRNILGRLDADPDRISFER
jgi:hypothetical protein